MGYRRREKGEAEKGVTMQSTEEPDSQAIDKRRRRRSGARREEQEDDRMRVWFSSLLNSSCGLTVNREETHIVLFRSKRSSIYVVDDSPK